MGRCVRGILRSSSNHYDPGNASEAFLVESMQDMPDQGFDDRRISRRKLLKRGAFAGLGLVGIDAFLIEPNWIALEKFDVRISGLPNAFDGFRIGQLTDIHWPRRISLEFVRNAWKLLRDQFQADVIVITGDIVDVYAGDLKSLYPLFEGIDATCNVYAVFGNHDHYYGANVVRRLLKETPIRLLENERVLLERGNAAIALGGVGDYWEGIVDLQSTFGGLPGEVPRVLLSHNPDLAEESVSNVRVDLQLSGHTHGGEVRLPLLPPLFAPTKYRKFVSGYAKGAHHDVFVSRGICSPRGARLFCRPQVCGITLKAAP